MSDPLVATLGEGMLELRRSGQDWLMGTGGDTLNVAVHLARLGMPARFITALGDDEFSEGMRRKWAAEGLDLRGLATVRSGTPGLYAINVGEDGERSFAYWRSDSAARRLLEHTDAVAAGLDGATVLHLSGITLAVLQCDLHLLLEIVADFRRRGGCVSFDTNYRPKLWHEADAARAAIGRISSLVDIALPSLEDERLLFGADATPGDYWLQAGVGEVVVKRGAEGADYWRGSQWVRVTPPPGDAIDTTGAGDAFTAGYLWLRSIGEDIPDAVRGAAALAGEIIRHSGAINIPRTRYRQFLHDWSSQSLTVPGLPA